MYVEFAVLGLLTFAYSTIAGRVDRMPLSGPIIFVTAGLLLGPLFLDVFQDDVSRGEFRVLVDLTLAIILFIDAANSNLSVLREQWRIPARMLGISLPLAIGLGFLFAFLLFDELSLFEAALLGTMLAATDAALGKAVVTNQAVPARLREGLNCESGLNDGLCVPVLLVFIALAHGAIEDETTLALTLVARELGIGALVGLTIAGTGAWILKWCDERGWLNDVWVQVAVPALALSCFAVAQSLHGSGYIAAFVGGMLFGAIAGGHTHRLVMPGEGIAEAMAMLTWLTFGVAVIGQAAEAFTWEMLLYAVLSLTAIRMLPVFLSLSGSGESVQSKLFLGWFGPRGLASIVFAIIVVDEDLPGSDFLAIAVTCTVGMSLLAHGFSANPLASWLAKQEVARPPPVDSAER